MIAFYSTFRPYGPLTVADAAPLADALKVLADPARLTILGLLRRHGSMTVSDLVTRLDMRQPNVSHHLKVLHQAGLIRTTEAGLREIVIDAVAQLSRMIDPGADAPTEATVDEVATGVERDAADVLLDAVLRDAESSTSVPHGGEASR